MMISIIAFAVLAAYLGIMAWKFGLPEMVSDTYYQLGRRWGWLFTADVWVTYFAIA